MEGVRGRRGEKERRINREKRGKAEDGDKEDWELGF